MATIEDLFSHVVIDRVISRLRGADHRMGAFYNMLPGMSAVDEFPGRKFAWDVFDNTRVIAQGRTPGSAAANVALQPVGTVLATAYRMYEQTTLDYERVFRNRGLGAPLGSVDARGERYIAKQMTHKLRRFNNAREFMIVRMFADGSFKLDVQGNDVIAKATGAGATGGEVLIDFQFPASNKLDVGASFGLGTIIWSDATAPIIDDLIEINDKSEKGARFPLEVAWCPSDVWRFIANNDQVRDTGGTANVWFNEQGFVPTVSRDPEDAGAITPGVAFVLRGFPQIKWYVYGDQYIDDSSTTPIDHLVAGQVIFTPNPSTEWLEWRSGSELVMKREGGPIEEQFGFGMWQEVVRNPLALSMFALDNGLPAPYVPNAWFTLDSLTATA